MGVMFSAVALFASREPAKIPISVNTRDIACKRKERTQLCSGGCELRSQLSQNGSEAVALAFGLHGGGRDGGNGTERDGNKGGKLDEREHSCSEYETLRVR